MLTYIPATLVATVALATSFHAVAAAAAAPAIDPATVAAADLAATHAEKYPTTIGFFLMLGSFIAFAVWYVRIAYPAQQAATERRVATAIEQGEQTRQFIAGALAKRGEEAAKAQQQIVDGIAGEVTEVGKSVDGVVKSVDGVAKSVDDVSKSIVVVQDRVEAVHDKVEAVHDRIDTVHGLVRLLAQKSGVGLVLLLCFSAGGAATALGRSALAAWHPVWQRSIVDPALSADCSGIGGCTSPSYCCERNVCCRNVNGVVASRDAVAPMCPCQLPTTQPAPSQPPPPTTPPQPPLSLPSPPPQPRSLAIVLVDYGDDPFAALSARRRQPL